MQRAISLSSDKLALVEPGHFLAVKATHWKGSWAKQSFGDELKKAVVWGKVCSIITKISYLTHRMKITNVHFNLWFNSMNTVSVAIFRVSNLSVMNLFGNSIEQDCFLKRLLSSGVNVYFNTQVVAIKRMDHAYGSPTYSFTVSFQDDREESGFCEDSTVRDVEVMKSQKEEPPEYRNPPWKHPGYTENASKPDITIRTGLTPDEQQGAEKPNSPVKTIKPTSYTTTKNPIPVSVSQPAQGSTTQAVADKTPDAKQTNFKKEREKEAPKRDKSIPFWMQVSKEQWTGAQMADYIFAESLPTSTIHDYRLQDLGEKAASIRSPHIRDVSDTHLLGKPPQYFFDLFLPSDYMVANTIPLTNQQLHLKHPKETPTTYEEIRALFLYIIAFSTIPGIASHRDYFSNRCQGFIPPLNFDQYGISIKRYEILMECLQLGPELSDDDLAPISGFITAFNRQMKMRYVPSSIITCDEGGTVWSNVETAPNKVTEHNDYQFLFSVLSVTSRCTCQISLIQMCNFSTASEIR